MSRRRATYVAPLLDERGDASPLVILTVVGVSILLSVIFAGLLVGMLIGASS
jgi:hypothetical protein